MLVMLFEFIVIGLTMYLLLAETNTSASPSSGSEASTLVSCPKDKLGLEVKFMDDTVVLFCFTVETKFVCGRIVTLIAIFLSSDVW